MIIGGGDDTVINHVKFTTIHKFKRTVAYERRSHPGNDVPRYEPGNSLQCHHRASMDTHHASRPVKFLPNMLGILRDIATHRLNVDPLYPPVRQMRRKFNVAINEAVSEEVDKLLANGSIRESKYPQWVANVVMVKNKNGKWRMCVDFTDLNKARPKDSFPLSNIDQLIDATMEHKLLSFLDAYSGYNQILMAEEDQEKTTFITYRGTYYYKVMLFGLKNTGATYQRLVTMMFKEQLGKTMEVYIDDMLVKSKKKEYHIGHLKEAFEILRQYGMKLNPKKCAFGVTSGKFLGFLVSQRGIEVNPDQIRAIKGIPETLTSKKQVLADFFADFSAEILPEVEQEALRASTYFDLWVLYTDGASNALGLGLGLVLKVPTGEVILQSIRCPEMTNNEALYEAVIAGLKLALKYGAQRLVLHYDSQLVVNQVTGSFQIKEQRLQKYQSEIHKLLPELDECRLNQIPRAQNIEADGLAKLATATRNINKENMVILLYFRNRPGRGTFYKPNLGLAQPYRNIFVG
ncbi:uncharacterized protein [Nicotiana sylvestris]|uniref:uncharacterized protein n=1 Tax=Nicotiana sylvestris TaxID=4096 RepID=UPI00388CD174